MTPEHLLLWFLLIALVAWLAWSGDRRRRQRRIIEQQAGQTFIPPKTFGDMPLIVRAEVGKLDVAAQAAFPEEYGRKAKSVGAATLAWILTAHYAYLGKWGLQVLFWLSLGGLFVWWVLDLFRLSGLVRDANRDAGLAALTTVKMLRA